MKHANCAFANEEEALSLAEMAKEQLTLALRDEGVTSPVEFDGPREIEYADGTRGWGLIARET